MTGGSRIQGILSLLGKHQCHQNHGTFIQQLHSCMVFTHHSLRPQHSLNVWNYLIRHYALNDSPQEAVFIFKYLQHQGHAYQRFSFDSFTYSFLLKAAANLTEPILGKQLHCCCCKVGFFEDKHVYVQTALLDMYVKCGYLVDAENVFCKMSVRNSVSWNALITGFVMWGQTSSAQHFFDLMPAKNVVSWTGLIDGYTRVGKFPEALSLFPRMLEEGIKPSEVTLLAIFPAIWKVRHISYCRMVHGYGEKSGLNSLDARVLNCLVDAYAKCGSIKCAERTFEDIADGRKSIVTWNSLISGFAMHGMANEASDMFRRMESKGIRANPITFLSILNGCSHSGLVNEGLGFFRMMVVEYGMIPDIKHYGCLIDMLGRSGRVEEAEVIANKIPSESNSVVVWRTLLGACCLHGNIKVAERVKGKIIEIERKYGGDYVLMSNIFADFGMFTDSERVRKIMDKESAIKIPGFSVSGQL